MVFLLTYLFNTLVKLLSILKSSASQPYTTVNQLDDGGDIASGATIIDSFRFGSNEKLFKSRKSTISGNSGAIEESKFLTSNTKKAFN